MSEILDFKTYSQIMGVYQMQQEDFERSAYLLEAYKKYLEAEDNLRKDFEAELKTKVKSAILKMEEWLKDDSTSV